MKTKLIFLFITLSLVSCNLGWSDADELFVSSGKGDLAKVKELLAKGVDVNHRFKHLQRDFTPYESALITAAENGHVEIVKYLVEAGADLEMSNTHNNQTALYMAVKNKHFDVIKYLLSVGAQPNVVSMIGRNSIMMLAVRQNNFSLIQLLRKYGGWPDPTVKSTDVIVGEVARNVVSAARALRRPYTSYLQNLESHCLRVMRTRSSCATVSVKQFKKSNKELNF